MTYLGRIPSTTGGMLMNTNLQASYRKLTNLQERLSSGKQITMPSDDPAGAVAALSTRSHLARAQQHERNASDAKAWLDTADSTMMSMQTNLQRVRDLTIQSRNGAIDQKGRDAIATEIDQITATMVQLGNARYGDRSIFSGTGNTQSPLQPNGQPIGAANDAAVMRSMAPGVDVQVNTTVTPLYGTWVGTAGGDYAGNTFEVLIKLANDIRNPGGPGSNVAAGQGALDDSMARIGNVQANLGARAKRVEDIVARNIGVSQELTRVLSDIEDIDLPRTIIDMQTQQMAYQAALAVTAKVIQPSLVDFLR
jgi:flagellar hook-associated protein 3 FlgL